MASRSVYVLSLSALCPNPAQGCVDELDAVFAELTDATVLRPRSARELETMLDALPAQQASLFVAAISLSEPINLLKEVPNWRRPFKRAACYVFDAWISDAKLAEPAWRRRLSRFHKAVAQFDHIFVSNPGAVARFQSVFGVEASHVAMAADVKRFGSSSGCRPITVNGYGRTHTVHVSALAAAYNHKDSGRSLYHTNHMVIGSTSNLVEHRLFFWKMLTLSRIALAYDPVVVDPSQRKFPYSFVGQRWYESLAAGCVVVGIRPRCAEADELLYWKDATLEVPERPDDVLRFIDDLLLDSDRLDAIRVSNYRHMLGSHDWSYRVETMLAALDIEPGAAAAARRAELRRLGETAAA